MLLFAEAELLPTAPPINKLTVPTGWDNKRPIDYSKALGYAEIGAKDKFWYRDCEETFIEIFGADKLKLVAKLFAATSINTSLKSNITLFRKAYYQLTNDIEFEGYLPNIMNQLIRIKNGDDLSGRKINNFQKAMSGDTEAIVVDIWLLRAFNQDRKYVRSLDNLERSAGATEKQYDLIETYVKDEARKMGLEPRQLCSMIWAGVRIKTNGDKETRYQTILKNHFSNLFNVI